MTKVFPPREGGKMGLSASIVIFAIGAILAFAVDLQTRGIDLNTVGVILMIVGAVGSLVSAMFLMTWSPWPYHRTVIHDHGPDHVHAGDPYVE